MRSRPSEGGFTLLEVLIALMLVSMVAVAAFSAYAVMLRGLTISARVVQAQGILERALMSAYAKPCEWEGTRADVIKDEGKSFNRYVETTATPMRLWKFDVRISWQQWGRTYEVRMLHFDEVEQLCPQWTP